MRIAHFVFCTTICCIITSSTIAQQDNDSVEVRLDSSNVDMNDILAVPRYLRRKGIYRTFDEFRHNSPSIIYDGDLVVGEETFTFSSASFFYYELSFEKTKLPCKNNTGIWGFCDGHSIYISWSSWFRKDSAYDKILFMGKGKYMYYQALSTTINGYMVRGMYRTSVYEMIIDLNDGSRFRLTRLSLKRILRSDPELLKSFKAEKEKKKVLLTYLKKYTNSHPQEVKPIH